MARFRPLGQSFDVLKRFASEDGTCYRHFRQELDPAIEHSRQLRQKVNEAPRSANRSGWHYGGSIPMTVLIDWLKQHGYSIDQWARNDGGGKATLHNYQTDPGVKAQFLRYFFSREYAKLHTQHVTTRKESATVSVPASIRRQAVEITL